MNREDIIQIAKTNTYDEFMEKYCSYHLCPSIYNLEVPKTRQECSRIDCTYCWDKALRDIKFSDVKSDEDKQNDFLDNLYEQELETQKDLINSTH